MVINDDEYGDDGDETLLPCGHLSTAVVFCVEIVGFLAVAAIIIAGHWSLLVGIDVFTELHHIYFKYRSALTKGWKMLKIKVAVKPDLTR